MKVMRLYPLLLAVLGAALQAFAQAPAVRLGELGDRPVVDARGAKIADIYDVVVDTEEGRAAYLVVSVGMKVVPIALPSPELGFTKDKVELTLDRAKLESSPALDMSALGPRYKRGRDIIGGKLKDPQGVQIGTVRDIIINLNDGVVANVVVEFDPAKVPGQKGWVALPRTSVKHDGVDFVATFNLEDMMPAEKAAAEARAREIARAKAVTVDRDERASQLIGRKVVDAQGKPVGEVADLAIDATGNLPYAIVNTGAARMALVLPSKDLKRAGDEIVLASGTAGLVSPPAGATRRASEILGKSLVDYRGKDVGKVRDIVVNLGAGKAHYAVAEFDASWVQGGHLVTIRLPKEDMKVELNALMGAMLFPPNGWPDLNGEQYLSNIDNYLKSH